MGRSDDYYDRQLAKYERDENTRALRELVEEEDEENVNVGE